MGANGEIILDEESTTVESTATKRAKADLSNSPAVVESATSKSTNYGTWSKRRRKTEWTTKETLRFYRALAVIGSDFSMMASLFKKRSREQLKLKFKKEEKANPDLVNKCLRSQGIAQFTDLQDFAIEVSETKIFSFLLNASPFYTINMTVRRVWMTHSRRCARTFT